jgi:hypothetical protein
VGKRAALDWCGARQGPVLDRQPSLDLTVPEQVHAVYVLPADGIDQYASLAGRIAADAAAISAWWERQDPGRAPRFDRFPFPGCTAPFADLDVGFLRLPRNGADYVDGAGDRLLADLGELKQLASAKLLIYYDGPPVLDPRVCGTAFIPSQAVVRLGGAFGLTFVWVRSTCAGDVGAGRLAAAVAAHELIHSLGALSQPGAPNECPPPDGGHVCDSPADILFPTASPDTTLESQILDVDRDDYYGHQGSWIDVQDSPWLARLPQVRLSLGVRASGGAGGRLEVAQPVPASCSASCAFLLDPGTQVTVTAVAAPGSRFLGFSGACSGTAVCTLRASVDTAVAGAFAPASFRLSVAVVGRGTVLSGAPRLACSRRCSTAVSANRSVRLRARPAPGFRFLGWSGACRGRGVCALTLDRHRSVTARFGRR